MNSPVSLPLDGSSSRPPVNTVAKALAQLAKDERDAEEARLARRKKRNEESEKSRQGSLSLENSAAGTPGGDDFKIPLEMPKKSALKAAKKNPSEQQAFAASNKTLNMALGSFGGKRLSWMNGGKPAALTNPYVNKPSSSKKAEDSGPSSSLAKSRVFGDLREEGPDGKGIQLRDVISVLERDGKEKKALQKAYWRLLQPVQKQ